MAVTLKDIAAEAGVSLMTVSNVVNGKQARVSAATRDRILRIVKDRGYVPSASARSLAAKSSRLVGLLVPAEGETSLTIDPHTVEVVGMLERELRRLDYHLMLRGISHRTEITEALRSWHLDGAVLLGFQDAEIDRLKADTVGGVALVAMDSYSANPLALEVRSDDFGGAELAVRHLIGLGHRRIAFAGPGFSETGVVRERFEGYRKVLAENGIGFEPELVSRVEISHAEGAAHGRWLAAERPDVTAVFTTADLLAIGVVDGLAAAGRSVPGDVSVVGYDNADIAAYVTPKLTTVAQDLPGKAAEAVRLMMDRLAGKDRPEQATTLGVRLIERDTAGPPPQ
ncbi:LacI family DNA-binding transcriptional regulator [Glycomyces algeriensis]|uniref:LacI family transcriptional regulator n=1 Tax=Glycomyces algeriensis TaxID=256037 RepID=A0A9W6GAR6_9ACTN|nr:LacI family DNA-binding transcriptional regulator [Glycomyces algeriensis]MDA1364730.1 LacI family DNA-binding transcriptional regulator [Glycomyces algeriensis]MDR7350771.1 LacI family transcriptional regulator [Glycomyces algeriensis]GLI43481.1 LacI family transcriptional regulator [Glycomyces algeriensis]